MNCAGEILHDKVSEGKVNYIWMKYNEIHAIIIQNIE